MATVLHITAHPHDHQTSYSMAVGKAFIDAYREANPNDEVVPIDLYRVQVPHIDADVFSGWGKLRSGQDFSSLTSDESAKVGRISELTEQFIAADKYVFVTPMWNFSFPPVMKAYLDALCVAGKTFKYTPEGPVGLLSGKKVLHIQARGGVYSEGPAATMESGHRYISIIMAFFGIPETQGLFVEGHNQFPDKAQQIKADAISKAQELAKSF